jgi:hypothetical protein
MDMKAGDDIYDSFRSYQRQLLKEYASMADEFGFRVIDGKKSVNWIQDELRRQIGAFLSGADGPAQRAASEGAAAAGAVAPSSSAASE